jgi:hypothetical protein
MIRHYDGAADAPRLGVSPCIQDYSHRIGTREERLAIFAADGEKDNNRFIESFPDRRMRWMSAVFHDVEVRGAVR